MSRIPSDGEIEVAARRGTDFQQESASAGGLRERQALGVRSVARWNAARPWCAMCSTTRRRERRSDGGRSHTWPGCPSPSRLDPPGSCGTRTARRSRTSGDRSTDRASSPRLASVCACDARRRPAVACRREPATTRQRQRTSHRLQSIVLREASTAKNLSTVASSRRRSRWYCSSPPT